MCKLFIQSIFLSIATILLNGCVPRHQVDVNAICTPQAINKTKYVLVAAEDQNDPSNIQFGEFAYYTERALQGAGFQKVACLSDADFAIFLDYNVSEPQIYQYAYSVPVYGQTGFVSTCTNSCVNTCGNTRSCVSVTDYSPTYGVIGSETRIGTRIVYFYYLNLFGWDANRLLSCNDKVMLWQVQINSSGETGDLRKMFPIMLAGAQGFIGRNSGEVVSVIVSENNDSIQNIKGLCDNQPIPPSPPPPPESIYF
jgi:hypothetical protein